ncbi:hypothetical protein [Marmoricola sp. URHB0036]|uniref:hypothetical protein n=1 Tax=Marmoricola sp. URHB0036 TaxID=1298863 RepID=UPI000423EE3C|nr:hypothetical protein [Marmoricola sp. URHB0036]
MASAVASLQALTPLVTLLTLATFLGVLVSGGVLVAWSCEQSAWAAVVPTAVASVLLTAWVALLVSSVGWACLLLVLVGASPLVLSTALAQVSRHDATSEYPTVEQLVRDHAWQDAVPEDASRPGTAPDPREG